MVCYIISYYTAIPHHKICGNQDRDPGESLYWWGVRATDANAGSSTYDVYIYIYIYILINIIIKDYTKPPTVAAGADGDGDGDAGAGAGAAFILFKLLGLHVLQS